MYSYISSYHNSKLSILHNKEFAHDNTKNSFLGQILIKLYAKLKGVYDRLMSNLQRQQSKRNDTKKNKSKKITALIF